MNIEKLITFIPFGRKNGISKKELSKKLFGMNDKAIIAMINQLRSKYIIFMNDEGNYYRPNDIQELQNFVRLQKTKRHITDQAIEKANEEIQRLKEES